MKYGGSLIFIKRPPGPSGQESTDRGGSTPPSFTHQTWRKIRPGKLKIEGDQGAVEALVLQGNIPIGFDCIATLMRTPNAFGKGPACRRYIWVFSSILDSNQCHLGPAY